jgi:hypothetical protein
MGHLVLSLTLIGGFFLCPDLGSKEQKQGCADCRKATARRSPKYQTVRRTPTVDGGLIVDVAIDKKRFNPDDLVALACALRKDFTDQPSVLVRIFDNKRSAKRYVSRWAQEKPAGWEADEKSLRAFYIREKARETVSWYRDPLHKRGETAVHLCIPQPDK